MSDLNHILKNDRRQYDKGKLNLSDLDPNPVIQFQHWFQQAIDSKIEEPNAMTLSTADNFKRPSSRIVLLKGITSQGLVFYSNYNSRKAAEIQDNPFVACNFFWQSLSRQVRFEGTIEKISEKDSDAYFSERPSESQVGAWASAQSQVINSREALEESFKKLADSFTGKDVPRPANWGGYLVIPSKVEFWQGQRDRLHDRFQYELNDGLWLINRLSP